ncbi:MAG: N-acetylmuramoyl-L-alanine amidase [Clostridia bacterium]|nr:N-acetylmuramoyl-L-alanine amidase [Clostridia bacterium]
MKEQTRARNYLDIWLLLAGFCAILVVIVGLWYTLNGKLPENVGRKLTEAELNEVIAANSPLIEYAYLSCNADFPRENKIDRITVHHMAGITTLEKLGDLFAQRDRQASANYAIDIDGKVGCYVEEKNRAWTSSSGENDHRAVTIEVSNDEIGNNWHVSDASIDALIELCTDICRRNNIEKLEFTGDTNGNLTIHSMFSDKTECPGPYLKSRLPDIAEAVNRKLSEAA